MQKYCYHCLSPLGGRSVCPYCGSDTAKVVQKEKFYLTPGTMLQNRYLIGECIGSGGFGITYAGMDLLLERKVAIKEYFPSDCVTRKQNDREIIYYTGELEMIFQDGKDSFIKEAKNLAKMGDIPGIVKIYDCIQEQGTSYIIMEFLEGKTVKAEMKERKKPFSWEETRRLLLSLLDALRLVHKAGLVHRDITPDNIFILNNGEFKLIDFGAARVTVTDHTHSFTVLLKPGFAPEEQYSTNGRQGPWTDVYALAATAYYMLTGQVPEDAISRYMEDRVNPPSSMNIQISPAEEKILMKALNIRYADRYQNADELKEALLAAGKESESEILREEDIEEIPVYEPVREKKIGNMKTGGRPMGGPTGSKEGNRGNAELPYSAGRRPENGRGPIYVPTGDGQRRGVPSGDRPVSRPTGTGAAIRRNEGIRYNNRRKELLDNLGDDPTVVRPVSGGSILDRGVSGGAARPNQIHNYNGKVLQPIPYDQIIGQKNPLYESIPIQQLNTAPAERHGKRDRDATNKTGLLIGLGIAVAVFIIVVVTVFIL